MKKKVLSALFIFPSAVFFAVFFILPLVLLGGKSFQAQEGGFTFSNYTEIITNPYYFRALTNSIVLPYCALWRRCLSAEYWPFFWLVAISV